MAGSVAVAVREPDRARVRPEPVDTRPSRRLSEVFHLLDDLAQVTAGSAALFRGIEQVTGLRVGEIQTLLAVVGGTDRIPELASRVGQPEEAGAVTVAGLVDRGLLQWHHPDVAAGQPDPTVARMRLTDAGAALLEQTEGVQIRLLDTLVASLGQEGVSSLRASLQALARLFGTMPSPTTPVSSGQ
jgi:hypothetical protein